jgi:hypothetical protein
LKKIYKYIFFSFYKWNYRVFGEDDLPVLNALLMTSLFTFLNFLTIFLLLEKVFSIGIFDFITSKKLYELLIALFNLVVNYFLLIYKKRYKDIINKIDSEYQKDKNRFSMYLLCYITFSLFSFLILFFNQG